MDTEVKERGKEKVRTSARNPLWAARKFTMMERRSLEDVGLYVDVLRLVHAVFHRFFGGEEGDGTKSEEALERAESDGDHLDIFHCASNQASYLRCARGVERKKKKHQRCEACSCWGWRRREHTVPRV
jgi:hypothetical protein